MSGGDHEVQHDSGDDEVVVTLWYCQFCWCYCDTDTGEHGLTNLDLTQTNGKINGMAWKTSKCEKISSANTKYTFIEQVKLITFHYFYLAREEKGRRIPMRDIRYFRTADGEKTSKL